MLYKIISNRTPFNTAESTGSVPLLEQIEQKCRSLEYRAAQLEEEHTFAQKVIDIQRSLLAVRTIPDLIHLLRDEFNILGAVEYDVQHYPDGTFSVEAMDYFGKGHSQDYTERFRFTQETAKLSSRYNMWRTIQQQRTTFINEDNTAPTIKFLIPINLGNEVSKVFKVEVAAPSSLRNKKAITPDVRQQYTLLKKYHPYFAEMLHAAFIRIETLKAPLAEKRYYEKIIEATSRLTDLFDDQGIVNAQVADIFLKSLMDIFDFTEIALYRYDRLSGQLDENASSILTIAQNDYPTVNIGEDFTPKGVKKLFLMLCTRALEDTGFSYLFEQGIVRWVSDQRKPLMLQIINWLGFKRPEGYPDGQISVEEECAEQINADIHINYAHGIITSSRLPASIGQYIRKKLFLNPKDRALRPKQHIENLDHLRSVIGRPVPEKDLEALLHLFERAQRITPDMFKQLGLIPIMTNDRYIDFLMVRKLRDNCDAEKELDIAPADGSEQSLAFTKGLNMIINDYNMIINGISYRQKLQELQPALKGRLSNTMHDLKSPITTLAKDITHLVKHMNYIQSYLGSDAETLLTELATYGPTHYNDMTYLQHLFERQKAKAQQHVRINRTVKDIEQAILSGRTGSVYTSMIARPTDLTFSEQLSEGLLADPVFVDWTIKVNRAAGYEKYRFDRSTRMLTIRVQGTGMTAAEFKDLKKTCTLAEEDSRTFDLLNSYSKILEAYDQCLSLAMSTENTLLSLIRHPAAIIEGLAGERTSDVDMLEHISEIVNECKKTPSFKDIDIELILPEHATDRYTVSADKETLGYCLKNMLENARKAIRVAQEEAQLDADSIPAEIRDDHELMALFFEDPEAVFLTPKQVTLERHSAASLELYHTVITPLINETLMSARQKKYKISVDLEIQRPASRLTDKNFMYIRVQDNGAGLSEHRLAHINGLLLKKGTKTYENYLFNMITPDIRFKKHELGSTGFGLQYGADYMASIGGLFYPLRSAIKKENGELQRGTTVSYMVPVSVVKQKRADII